MVLPFNRACFAMRRALFSLVLASLIVNPSRVLVANRAVHAGPWVLGIEEPLPIFSLFTLYLS